MMNLLEQLKQYKPTYCPTCRWQVYFNILSTMTVVLTCVHMTFELTLRIDSRSVKQPWGLCCDSIVVVGSIVFGRQRYLPVV